MTFPATDLRNRGLAAVIALSLGVACAGAQSLVLQDGRTVPATKLRRAGETVLVPVQIGTSQGEAGYPLSTVVRADFPEPAQLSLATDLIAQGKVNDALTQLTPVVDFFQPIAEVPGSWWPQLALRKAEALEKSGRPKESEVILEQIVRASKHAPTVEMARIRLARSMITQKNFKEALAVCEAALAKHAREGAIAAEAWLCQGDIWLAQREFEPALMAYLHVPALYGRQTSSIPPALLGSARAYLGLKDTPHATTAFSEITRDFPSTAEAKTAAEELQRIAKTEPQKQP